MSDKIIKVISVGCLVKCASFFDEIMCRQKQEVPHTIKFFTEQ